MICEKHNFNYEPKKFSIAGTSYEIGCPLCEKERRKEQDRITQEEQQEAKVELKKIENEKKLQAQNIEKEYFNATLDNYVTKTESQASALRAFKSLVNDDAVQKIILLGDNGVGKTHLGSAAVKLLDGVIMTAYEISLFIRDGVAKGEEKKRLDIVSSYPLLVVDEWFRTKMSDAERNWHSYIFDKRHVRGLKTVLMGNGHFRRECLSGGCAKCLETTLDNDSISRFMQRGIILSVEGPDQRRENWKQEK